MHEDPHAHVFAADSPLRLGWIKNLIIGVLVLGLLYTWLTPRPYAARSASTPVIRSSPDPIEKATNAFLAMESANRGFLLTGDQSYRDTFNLERDRFSESYKTLMSSSAGQERRKHALKAIKDKFTRWFRLYNPMIQNRRSDSHYVPNKDKLLECRLVHEEILTDLAHLRPAASAASE